MLNEMQWNRDAIELQLSHMERDASRESYNSATHLPLRRQMMKAWADRPCETSHALSGVVYWFSPHLSRSHPATLAGRCFFPKANCVCARRRHL